MRYDGLRVEDLGAEWRVARKQHDCQCGDPIRKGERYFRRFARVEGQLTVLKEGDHVHWFEDCREREPFDA